MLKNQQSSKLQKRSAKSKQEQHGTAKKYTARSVRAELERLGLGKSCLPLQKCTVLPGANTSNFPLSIYACAPAPVAPAKPSPHFIEVLADKIVKPRKRTPKESAIFFKKCRRAAHVLATQTNELFRVFVVLK